MTSCKRHALVLENLMGQNACPTTCTLPKLRMGCISLKQNAWHSFFVCIKWQGEVAQWRHVVHSCFPSHPIPEEVRGEVSSLTKVLPLPPQEPQSMEHFRTSQSICSVNSRLRGLPEALGSSAEPGLQIALTRQNSYHQCSS